MAEQQNDNKRALIGVAIFAFLIIANLLVRSGGKNSTTRAVNPPVAAPVVTVGAGPATPPPQPIQNVQAPANLLTASIPLPTETGGINEQILLLNQQAENFAQRVAAVAEPFLPPDRGFQLPFDMSERFRWSDTASDSTVIQTEAGPVASQAKTIAIIGEFQSGERRKFLVREDDRVYIVSENQLPQEGTISVSSGENGNIIVKDTTGQLHDLPRITQQRDQKLEEAIRVLKGGATKQTTLDFLTTAGTASVTAKP
ncbi:MAG TPA: hypothetical protein PLK28_03990 [Candidatus Rifleibacterium sp.]|nr:hypothetical protein [Candidatus Rifleibacterium sp.]